MCVIASHVFILLCRAISCGAEHTIAITPQDVITWGSNENGQCGHGEKAEIDWVKPRSLKVIMEQKLHYYLLPVYHCKNNRINTG